MSEFIVDQAFWDIFPAGKIFVLVAHGLDNCYRASADQAQAVDALNQAARDSAKCLTAVNFSDNPVVAQWRAAFQQFKTKKGARSSVEALLKRAHQGREFGSISPLVDFYNTVSLKHMVPAGGEDIATLVGDMHLGVAGGGEDFYTLGSEKNEPALPGEVCYFDEAGAICRCLNWREGMRTMLTEATRDAVFFIETTDSVQAEAGAAAIADLKAVFDGYFGIDCTVAALELGGQTSIPLTKVPAESV
jgi:DNA/RNA-binding domain of Phe-tRNA-synthetase-like protein